MNRTKIILAVVLILAGTGFARASEHGPVFGLATPTNVKGGWSVDFGTMARVGTGGGSAMERAMLTYGVTPDVQVSISGPAVFASTALAPGRVTAMMPSTGNFEALGAWRFQRWDNGVGSRIETTAYAGLILPSSQKPPGIISRLHWAPGVVAMIATGYASRKNYFWAGIGGTHFGESHGDRRPGMMMYSLVYGYRPKAFRKNYPHWDGRFFVEMTGEYSSRVQYRRLSVPGTDGEQVFIGPATLWIYKNYGIEGGIQFPIYRKTGPAFERERYRLAIDFSYFF